MNRRINLSDEALEAQIAASVAHRERKMAEAREKQKEYRKKRFGTAPLLQKTCPCGTPFLSNNPQTKFCVPCREERKFPSPRKNGRLKWVIAVEEGKLRCFYCGCQLTLSNWSRDHKQPRSKGGLSDAANLVPCCRSCNSHKQALTASEFIEIRKSKNLVVPVTESVIRGKDAPDCYFSMRFTVENVVDEPVHRRLMAVEDQKISSPHKVFCTANDSFTQRNSHSVEIDSIGGR